MTTVEIDWDLSKKSILGSDPETSLRDETTAWFQKMELFRKAEKQRMYLQHPLKEDMEIHKQLLLRLIADGDHLANVIQHSRALIQDFEGMKSEGLIAAVKELRETYRGWHEPMTPAHRGAILSEILGAW